jgi:hypothetical protein
MTAQATLGSKLLIESRRNFKKRLRECLVEK